jgi:hypothetical protein
LRSGQLVGTALIVLCKKEVAAEVRNVEAAIKKVRLASRHVSLDNRDSAPDPSQ